MVYAHAEAERQYRTALGLAREIEDEDHEREVMEKLGRLLELTARYDEALGFLEGAAKLYRSVVDREGEARVVGLLGWLHHSRDQYEEGAARIQTLLEELEDAPPSPGLVSLWSALASIRFAEGRNQETLVAAQRATDCARAVGDNRLLAEAEERRGLALSMAGQPQAREVLENAARLAESVGDLTTLGRALNNLSAMPYEGGEVETARSFEERALQVAERNGDVQLVNLIGIKLSDDALGRGQWSQARADLERVRDVLRRMDASSQTGYPLIGLARLSRAEGRWEEAYRSLKEATALAERDGDRPLMWAVQFELAALDLEQGRAETAAVRLRTRLDEANLNKYLHANLLANLAEAHLRMGDVAGAEELASESVERAAALMQGSFLVWPFRVKGMVLAEQGRWDEAEVAFEQALALSRKMEAVYREGRILYEYGIMYARKGEPERARDLLEAALAIFRGLGARPYIERTEQALARALEEEASHSA
jgi:tetratricopeptide (TPR) repeat protein